MQWSGDLFRVQVGNSRPNWLFSTHNTDDETIPILGGAQIKTKLVQRFSLLSGRFLVWHQIKTDITYT